jgi:hypothetical protein
MNSIDLAQFFRFFGPGGVGVMVYLYSRYTPSMSLPTAFMPAQYGTAIGIIVIAVSAAFLGFLFSTIYHGIINLRICGFETGLAPNHRDFLRQASAAGKLKLVDLGGDDVTAERISVWGASSIVDGLFYRLYERRKLSNFDANRFERYFHILHGLGTTILASITMYCLGLIHDLLQKSLAFNMADFSLPKTLLLHLPVIFVLIIMVANWINLRKIAIGYVESWLLEMLDANYTTAKIYVRPGQIRSVKP